MTSHLFPPATAAALPSSPASSALSTASSSGNSSQEPRSPPSAGIRPGEVSFEESLIQLARARVSEIEFTNRTNNDALQALLGGLESINRRLLHVEHFLQQESLQPLRSPPADIEGGPPGLPASLAVNPPIKTEDDPGSDEELDVMGDVPVRPSPSIEVDWRRMYLNLRRNIEVDWRRMYLNLRRKYDTLLERHTQGKVAAKASIRAGRSAESRPLQSDRAFPANGPPSEDRPPPETPVPSAKRTPAPRSVAPSSRSPSTGRPVASPSPSTSEYFDTFLQRTGRTPEGRPRRDSPSDRLRQSLWVLSPLQEPEPSDTSRRLDLDEG
ncbi:hypothetical protein H696_03756 [Fonticula alba]|uniref:Uncharacterized protein n=1 Tax=Fonticula alba TaxID=691883 RepID=A0A058Z4W1_FONAL|nr:hypothetical protein H696_03756 [Fonticula alba]KCV69324.1 hypothetical protein H696_03756 [Fonticula alba]|eukprot:XP_009495889.1 hypothetical protein H696_03756 [Fonticula alba]